MNTTDISNVINPNTNTQNKSLILQGHSRPIKDATFSSTGEYIFTASSDRNVVDWNTNTGEKIKIFTHDAAVNIVRLTSDDKIMITGDNTGCVYLWDISSKILLKKIEQDPSLFTRSIDISSDMMMVTYAGRIKGAASFINVYKLQDILDYEKEEIGENNSNGSTYHNKMSNISGLMKQPLSLLTATTENVIPESFPPYKKFICSTKDTKYVKAKFAIMNKSLIVGREDGYLELINFMNGKIITESKFHNDIILDFDVDSSIGLVFTASRDGTACVINLDTFQLLNRFHPQNPTRNLNACKLAVLRNPEIGTGTYNLTAEEKETEINNNLDVNYVQNVSRLKNINSESNAPVSKPAEILKIDVDNLFDNRDDTRTPIKKIKKEIIVGIVSGGQDSKFVTTTNQKEGGFEIIIYDVLDGTECSNFLSHFGPVNSLAVNKSILASGAEDATVRLYKLENYLFDNNK